MIGQWEKIVINNNTEFHRRSNGKSYGRIIPLYGGAWIARYIYIHNIPCYELKTFDSLWSAILWVDLNLIKIHEVRNISKPLIFIC